MFMRTRTRPAAGSGASIRCLHRDEHREQLHEPPEACNTIAPASGTGRLEHGETLRAMLTNPRRDPIPSLTMGRSCRFAPSHAIVNSAKPTRAAIVMETTAQCGTSAVSSTQTTRIDAGTRSKRRWAKTVPTRVALVPGGASGR